VRLAVDTNVLAYAEGVNDAARRDIALDVLDRLGPEALVVPIQVLGELFNMLTRKVGWPAGEARQALLGWRDTFALAETSPDVMLSAADLATDHGLTIWDAVILCTASAADCQLLLSEDLQEGFTWGGVTVANPFAATLHPLLEASLEGRAGGPP
jgi:predicted nucleic acid-binding protein